MIQRAQSIYMFLVVVLMSLIFVFPIANFEYQDGSKLKFFIYGLINISNEKRLITLKSIPLVILVIVIAFLNFYNIFLFTKRTKQMRILVYTILLQIGLIFLILFYYRYINNNMPVTSHVFKISLIFPAVAIFLNIMALRAIGRDEMLVRSYERLRK